MEDSALEIIDELEHIKESLRFLEISTPKKERALDLAIERFQPYSNAVSGAASGQGKPCDLIITNAKYGADGIAESVTICQKSKGYLYMRFD
jgi:hypothetical protein